jgi:hypothetical protein
VALCNALIYFAHNTTLNVPYIFWSMGALYAYLRVLQQQAHWRWYVLLGAFAAVALATKDQAYGLVILLPMPILIVHWRRRASRHLTVRTLGGLLFERNLVLAGGSFLIAYALSNNLLFNFPRWILHINGISRYRVWDRYLDPSSIADHWRLFVLTMGYLVRSMGLPLFLLSLGGLVYCVARFPRRTWPLLVPLLSYYFLVIVGAFFYVHARHVMPLAFILGVFGGKAAIDLINSTAAPKWASYSLLALVLGYSLLYGSNADITLLNDSRHAAGLWMRENVPSNARVEVYDPPIWLPWFLNDYEVHLEEFSGDYAAGLRARRPDFVIVTERLYRGNADRVEAPCFLEASQSNPELRGLLSGELGYRLQAMFKFKLHDWFFPDMFYGQNPRILIFQRVSE